MRYFSFFSGIGGFEVAIHKRYPNATCLGYSEILPAAIRVYERHFPNHENMGDITEITKKEIQRRVQHAGGCDLVVGGFPCKNLSSLSRITNNNQGIQGKQSGLFFELIRILKMIVKKNPMVDIVIENNASMPISECETITMHLQAVFGKRAVYMQKINSGLLGVQRRNRIYWTTFPVELPTSVLQTWSMVLDPVDVSNQVLVPHSSIVTRNTYRFKNIRTSQGKTLQVLWDPDVKAYYYVKVRSKHPSRWDNPVYSDTCKSRDISLRSQNYVCGKARVITTDANSNLLIDRRGLLPGYFRIRRFSKKELSSLFGFPKNYLEKEQQWTAVKLAGNAVVVYVIDHILSYM